MTSIRTLLAIGIAATSFAAVAQTANTPGGQAATGTPLDQTKSTPSKSMPSSTATTPDSTNPSGSVTHGASPSTSSGMAPSRTSAQTGKATTAVPPGDVPTYPAPAKDGTPTK